MSTVREFTVNIITESGFTNFSVSPSARVTFVRGDIIRISNDSFSSVSVSVGSFDSQRYGSGTLNMTIAAGAAIQRGIISTATLGDTALTVSGGGQSRTILLSIVASLDSTPASFSLGGPQTGLNPNVEVFLPNITITGINTSVTATGTNLLLRRSNGGGWTTNLTVVEGTVLLVKATSPANYNQTVRSTLTVGGTTAFVDLSTKLSAETGGTFFPFPVPLGSAPISLSQIISFYAGTTPRNLNAFRKTNLAGSLIPNITQNANIAGATGNISLSQFRGSGTTLFFAQAPISKNESAITTGGAQSRTLTWIAGTDFQLGFGPRMSTNVNYRYVVTQDSGGGLSTGISIFPANHATYSQNNNTFSVQASAAFNQERIFQGSVTVFAQSRFDASIIASSTFSYGFVFTGP